ncbi:MAG: Mg-chelatase subunit ChlD, partial [Bradymonadia bacterium]
MLQRRAPGALVALLAAVSFSASCSSNPGSSADERRVTDREPDVTRVFDDAPDAWTAEDTEAQPDGRPDTVGDAVVAADTPQDAPVADATEGDTAQDPVAAADTEGDGGIEDPTADVPVEEEVDAGCTETIPILLKPTDSAIPNVVLVVDRSYSMIQNPTRWDGVTTAVRDVTGALDEVVRFGMVLFPDPASNACAVGTVSVEPGLRVSTEISSALARWEPAGGTPTAPSLRLAGELLARDFPDGNNYILLATDGAPGCNPVFEGHGCECIPGAYCGEEFWGNCLDDERTLETMTQLTDLGISTFVVGVPGSDIVSDLMDRMAIIGGTDIEGRHYAVDDGPVLLETLREATGGLVPCAYSIADGPDGGRVVSVLVDGVAVPNDISDGWISDADGDLVFAGATCESLRDGREHRIE